MSGSMEDGMDGQAFSALVSAYGADPKRWPEDRRAKAALYSETAEGQRLLNEAAQLDRALAAFRPKAEPSAALQGRILADGTARLSSRRRFVRFGLGAGMVGISLAGALTGAVAVINLTPPPSFSFGDNLTAFGNLQSENELAEEAK